MSENNAGQNEAKRRVKLHFDKNGEPYFPSVTSPESFKVRAMAIKLPHDVIPVIFVPGIMGSNLRNKESGTPAWKPPNGTQEEIKAVRAGSRQTPIDRQKLFNPADTEVAPDGPCPVPGNVYWLTTEEAQKRRGWGSLHAESYLDILLKLETVLNDRYIWPGHTKKEGNFLLKEIGLLAHLKGGPPQNDPADEQTRKIAGLYARTDYAGFAQKAMAAWGTQPPALSGEEIKRLGQYYYPVWAFGYNWLRSNAEAGDLLVKKIDEIINYYNSISYFNCAGKVILVTHSMGGLVARWAAMKAESKILGVVHCVQPVAGAPVVYRRFRAGTESGAWSVSEKGFATIVGNDAAHDVPALVAPGPLELAPNCHYPPGWLRVQHQRTTFGKPEELHRLPKSDPYEEIYGKTTDECWWGMIDPALLDPAGKKKDPIEDYRETLKRVKKFHAQLKLKAHPQTYGFYGVDKDAYPAFGHVAWEVSHNGEIPPDLMTRKDRGRSLKGHALVSLAKENPPEDKPTTVCTIAKTRIQSDLAPALSLYEDKPTVCTIAKTFELLNERNQAGDGTVPVDSGRALERLAPPPRVVFRLKGMDHQHCFDHESAVQALVYSIARIIQSAPPPTPPKSAPPPDVGTHSVEGGLP
jgi:pimeloyl-ACP methyl ester carboxylesterase